MKRAFEIVCVAAVVAVLGSTASGDDFGTGGNRFTIDFVTISGDASSDNGRVIGFNRGFSDPGNDYRMGIYEIAATQWDKFKASYGVVTGDPISAYDADPSSPGTSTPVDNVSWYEAVQFVNWLNISTGHQAAYKFTGTRGTSDYAFATWGAAEAAAGTNSYRHKDAFYYLPTDDEWAKAAYWNGTTLQFWATKPGESVYQGDGVSGTGWNYFDNGPGPSAWDVTSGSEELNGTFNMMGNASEWIENPYEDPAYGTGSDRSQRGGWRYTTSYHLACYARSQKNPDWEGGIGFRVAAAVPEPTAMSLVLLGGLAVLRRRRR